MRKVYIISLLILGWFQVGFAQVSTVPAEDIDPEDSLKIIVDISKLDASQEHVQNLQAAAAAGEDLYIWTWQPFEFPAGHPKANGTGAQAWKNSNELLKMTKEATNIYSYSMIPTEFYEVDAATVYEEDIHFLVKPKDGGGYGDPDRKSDDLKVTIDPPKLERDPSYAFPEVGQEDDIFTIYYENERETKPSMQNLGPNDVYLFASATLSDSTTINIAPSLFQTGSYPELKMDYASSIDSYRKFIYPRMFFNVPNGLGIVQMKFVVQKQTYASSADRTDNEVIIEIGCP